MKTSVDILTTKSEPKRLRSTSIFQNVALVLGVVMVLIMINTIGIDKIKTNILSMGWWFAAIILIWFIVYLMNALAWYVILSDNKSERLPYSLILKFTITGYAINYCTPMGLVGGEPYRIMELRQYVGTEKATSSVILFAMMHVVSHFIFWIIAALLVAFIFPMSIPFAAILAAIFICCTYLIYLFYKGYKKGLLVNVINRLNTIPYVRNFTKKISPEKMERMALIDEQIAYLHTYRKKAFYGSLALEYFSRVFSCLEVYFIIRALGEYVPLLHCVFIVAFSSLFANLFFFSPMQLGTREGGYFLALKGLALPAGLGISVSLITRIREAFWIMIGLSIMKIKNIK